MDTYISDLSTNATNINTAEFSTVQTIDSVKINSNINFGIIFLIAVAIVIFIILLIVLIYNNTTNVTAGTTTGIKISNHCTPAPDTLPDLSFLNCCENFGTLTSNKYLQSLNMTVSLTPVPIYQACSSFCSAGFDPVNKTCLGNITSDDSQFNLCVNKGSAINCTDVANPVAISNGQYMYASSAGSVLCSTLNICSLVI